MGLRLSLLSLLSLAGCMTTYQPLSGLHQPFALDLRYAHFSNLTLRIDCVSSEALKPEDARGLCLKLRRLFENQGARVLDENTADLPDLRLRLSARVIHEGERRFLWWRWITDYTFAQDITVHDERGALLSQATLIGRFTRRLGFSGQAKRRFSEDFYGQLAQLTLNARTRRRVLREGAR
ncbi:hypothetical protein KKF91_15725 [Myxococcota bacterium]|nr:hypothetical protein [Myxococcota bacterium]MBU1431990.1 hypothetical protein [Myxococcota bacterium]MBU1897028.1 hypothetical protein [Myxococcota bacterium]